MTYVGQKSVRDLSTILFAFPFSTWKQSLVLGGKSRRVKGWSTHCDVSIQHHPCLVHSLQLALHSFSRGRERVKPPLCVILLGLREAGGRVLRGKARSVTCGWANVPLGTLSAGNREISLKLYSLLGRDTLTEQSHFVN